MHLSRQALFPGKIIPALTFGLLVFAIAPLAWGEAKNPPPPENFGQYLVAHGANIEPFFTKNANELLGQGVPLVLLWLGNILIVSLLAGWGVDILLGRGFALLFSSTRNKFRQAFIYATGRMAINLLLLVLLESMIVNAVGHAHLRTIVLALIAGFGMVSAALQIGWICYFYRTNAAIGLLFYLTLIVVHGFITLGIATPLSGMPASASSVAFVNKTLAPEIEVESEFVREKLATVIPKRDKAAAEAARLQGGIAEAESEQAELRKQIELAKNSENSLYVQIMKIHARGDLAAARDRLTALLAQFPQGPVDGLVRGQLTQVTKEMAAQDAQAKRAAADRNLQATEAQAHLLALANRGQATLSDLRGALLGKSRAEVSALFGQPSETASDRWGFSRQMVLNPLTNETSGLAVYFDDGAVQSVDYYYGESK